MGYFWIDYDLRAIPLKEKKARRDAAGVRREKGRKERGAAK